MKYFFLLLSLAFFAACGNSDVSSDAELQALEASRVAQEAAHEGMMASHDRIMPMMGQVTAAQRAIKEQLDADQLNDDRKDLLEAAYEQLEDADAGMMKWMNNLKPLAELRESMDHEAIITFIREVSAEGTNVETAINTSVASAKELVGDHSGHDHGEGDHSGHNH